jgi:serine-threonine kinase receptor-associated protein
MEKKLRIFDLDRVDTSANGNGFMNGNTNGASDHKTITADMGFEVGAGVHGGTIKSIVWTHDPNILVTAADDKTIRWWDLQTQSVVQQQSVQGDIGSCEFTNIKGEPGDIGGGLPILTIAAGKTVYFYGGVDARTLIRSITLPYDVASVALHPIQRKFVTGGMKDTWAKVYDYDSEQEIGRQSRLGPILMLTFLQMYTKVITVRSGASASPQTANSTPPEVRMVRSRCGRIVRVLLACGVHKTSVLD